MNIGDRVYTPRFCTVRVKALFDSRQEAEQAGFTEPTYYEDPSAAFGVSGKRRVFRRDRPAVLSFESDASPEARRVVHVARDPETRWACEKG